MLRVLVPDPLKRHTQQGDEELLPEYKIQSDKLFQEVKRVLGREYIYVSQRFPIFFRQQFFRHLDLY